MLSFFNELHKFSPLEQAALKQKYGADVIVNIHRPIRGKNGQALAILVNDEIKAVIRTNWDDTVTITEKVKA